MSSASSTIELTTLAQAEEFTGDAAAAYPQAVYLADRVFDWPIFIVAIQFSTSLVIFPGATDNYGGLFLTLGQNGKDRVAIGEGLKSVVEHHTYANSIPGVTPIASPSSKVSNITFGGCGFYLPAGSPITLWGFAEATAGNSLLAVTSIQYRRKTG